MGLFEEQPLLLVPFVLTVVMSYDGAKWLVKRWLTGRTAEAVVVRKR